MTMNSEQLVTSAQQIVDAIGYDAAITLIARHGGRSVILHEIPDGRDLVAQAIGQLTAQRLAQYLGAGPLALPRCAAWLVARRNEEVALRAASGETRSELAQRFGLTERHIYSILAMTRSKQQSPL